ncbi:MAG: HypC/HybG/HupF family hydrogenase formation chaperone [Abditibacteriota bacterium]|nr:HypC/HybG/HupF family hydrogenase formation chaperone [Abditibacteriota bacterium]
MCVAYPLKVTEVNGRSAVGEAGGLKVGFDCGLCPGVKPGDYVLVHAGCAIEILDPGEARETLLLFDELKEALEDG